jgi:hypothetical protein
VEADRDLGHHVIDIGYGWSAGYIAPVCGARFLEVDER